MTQTTDDSGEVPKSNGVVGGSIAGREIVSLLDSKKLARWSGASCVPKEKVTPTKGVLVRTNPL